MSTKQKDTDKLDPAGGNVEQIREILFGGHIRAFDDRFELVESRLAKESKALRKAIEKRVLELERLLGEFRDEASDQLKTEIGNRELALNKIELAMAQARMDAEKQMSEMQDRFSSRIKSARAALRSLHKELSSALSSSEKAQERRSDKLTDDKVNRKDLSKFFSDIANRLQPTKAKPSK